MLVAGEFMGQFRTTPEVKDTVLFMTSSEYANARAAESAWMSANTGLDVSVYTDPLDKRARRAIPGHDITRFDGGDLVPPRWVRAPSGPNDPDSIGTSKDAQDVLDRSRPARPADERGQSNGTQRVVPLRAGALGEGIVMHRLLTCVGRRGTQHRRLRAWPCFHGVLRSRPGCRSASAADQILVFLALRSCACSSGSSSPAVGADRASTQATGRLVPVRSTTTPTSS